MLVMAVDPGETTGIAVARHGDEFGQVQVLAVSQVEGKEALTNIESVLLDKKVPLDAVVVEDFRLYPWKSNAQAFSQMQTARLIGVIEFLCERHEMPIVLQPASCKDMIGDIFLKKSGLWVKGKPHARDAIKHVLYYLLLGGGSNNAAGSMQ